MLATGAVDLCAVIATDQLMLNLLVDRAANTFPYSLQSLVVIVLATCMAVLLARRLKRVGDLNRHAATLLTIVGGLAILSVAVTAACYSGSLSMRNANEGNVAAVSWHWGATRPLYHDFDSEERYSMLYGPTAYGANRLVMSVLGPGVRTSKIAGGVCCTSAILLVLWALTREVRWGIAVPLAGYCALVTMINPFGPSLYISPRADAQVLFWLSLGIAAARWRNANCSAAMTGIAAAMAVNAKINLAPLLLVFPLLSGWRHSHVRLCLYFLAAAATGLAPFALPGVSMPNYLRWLAAAGQHGFEPNPVFFLRVCLHIALPIIGIIMICWELNREELVARIKAGRYRIAGLSLAWCPIAISAMKVGSGPQHMVAMSPFLALMAALALRACHPQLGSGDRASNATHKDDPLDHPGGAAIVGYGLIAAFTLTSSAHAFGIQADFVRSLWRLDAEVQAIHEEISAAQTPSRVVFMGYGSSDEHVHLSAYNIDLVAADQPLVLDGIAMMDMQKAGIEFPEKTLRWLENLDHAVWLIPRDEEPFEILNMYPPREKLFPPEFRRMFHERFEKVRSGVYFDVWQNRRS